MEKKILLAVDDSTHSRRALEYAARMSAVIPQMTVTLFHVQPTISRFLIEEAGHHLRARSELKSIIARNGDAARELLARHKETLLRVGMADAAVQMVSFPRHLGLARDILDYAQNNLLDAVLVGRRGLSSLQQMVMGSVTSSLIENSRVIPTWIVDGEVRSTRLMIAADGSESALRAVDHLAFMLSGYPEAAVSFFHVTPKLKDYCEIDFSQAQSSELAGIVTRGDKRCMDDFFAAALKRLDEAGIRGERIESRTGASLMGVGEAILKAQQEGGFGTLVVGRRGLSSSFFSGSVSGHLSQKLTNAALWIVP
jgi:nucleotide-binding universal stress UspA family protein